MQKQQPLYGFTLKQHSNEPLNQIESQFNQQRQILNQSRQIQYKSEPKKRESFIQNLNQSLDLAQNKYQDTFLNQYTSKTKGFGLDPLKEYQEKLEKQKHMSQNRWTDVEQSLPSIDVNKKNGIVQNFTPSLNTQRFQIVQEQIRNQGNALQSILQKIEERGQNRQNNSIYQRNDFQASRQMISPYSPEKSSQILQEIKRMRKEIMKIEDRQYNFQVQLQHQIPNIPQMPAIPQFPQYSPPPFYGQPYPQHIFQPQPQIPLQFQQSSRDVNFKYPDNNQKPISIQNSLIRQPRRKQNKEFVIEQLRDTISPPTRQSSDGEIVQQPNNNYQLPSPQETQRQTKIQMNQISEQPQRIFSKQQQKDIKQSKLLRYRRKEQRKFNPHELKRLKTFFKTRVLMIHCALNFVPTVKRLIAEERELVQKEQFEMLDKYEELTRQWILEIMINFVSSCQISLWKKDFTYVENAKLKANEIEVAGIEALDIIKIYIECLSKTIPMISKDLLYYVGSFSMPSALTKENYHIKFVIQRLTPNTYGRISAQIVKEQIMMIFAEFFFLKTNIKTFFNLHLWFEDVLKVDKLMKKIKVIASILQLFFYDYFQRTCPITTPPSNQKPTNQYFTINLDQPDMEQILTQSEKNDNQEMDDLIYQGLYTEKEIFNRMSADGPFMQQFKLVQNIFRNSMETITNNAICKLL